MQSFKSPEDNQNASDKLNGKNKVNNKNTYTYETLKGPPIEFKTVTEAFLMKIFKKEKKIEKENIFGSFCKFIHKNYIQSNENYQKNMSKNIKVLV